MSKQDLIRSVDLKLARAKSQVAMLADEISAWSARNPINTRQELREGGLGFRVILEDFVDSPPLDDWGLLIGECVHNLRSALDNLAYSLARLKCDPPSRPDRVRFPICEDRSKFKKENRRSLDQMQAEAVSLIEQLQPFQRERPDVEATPDRDPLVLLRWLSNRDKHRVPPVVLLNPAEIRYAYGAQFYSSEDLKANMPPDATVWLDPLKPGAVLMEHRTTRPIKGVIGNSTVHARVAIETETGHKRVSVDKAMGKLSTYTAEVVDLFRGFFK